MQAGSAPMRAKACRRSRMPDGTIIRAAIRMDLNSVLSPLKGLPLKARMVLEGTLAGRHLSPFHGFSSEFSRYKGYSPGDDLKYLDWKVLARSDQLVTRQYRDETNACVYLVVDSSASMGYAGPSGSKSGLPGANAGFPGAG